MENATGNDRARRRLFELCREVGERCPRCGEKRHYPLRDGRRRCPGCGYTYHLFTGRWINKARLAPAAWPRLLDCFSQGLSVREAADRLGIKYDTAHKAYAAVRLAILTDILDAGDILDDGGELVGFCPNLGNDGGQALCQGCRSYVFALNLRGGLAELSLARGLTARETLASPTPRKSWGALVYTDRHCGRDALIFSCCRRGRELYLQDVADAPFLLDAPGGFKEFAEPWFAKYRGFAPEAYPLYLAETVFRHNRRQTPLAPLLARLLCRFVPKHGE